MATTDRSERILALLLLNTLKEASQQTKVVQLSLAGFSNFEIADLLQTTSAVVATSLYTAKKTGRGTRGGTKAPKKKPSSSRRR
jgi:DNA-directed RNA polymerase specialized sigma24 family protein